MQNPQDVKLATQAVKKCLPEAFRSSIANGCGIILGTGLSDFPDILSESFSCKLTHIPFSQIPGFPRPRVASHGGSLVAGVCNEIPFLIQTGRTHLYEGYSPAEICLGVRVMAALGLRTLIITNAAGSLNPLFLPGSLMCMTDYINHTGVSPLTGMDPAEHRFTDMSCPFDTCLRAMALTASMELNMRLEQGVYIGVHGPEMETPAETRMYRQWGADAVGMSTVLEVIAARQADMAVLGISCLTNQNLPDYPKPVPIEEVEAVAQDASHNLAAILCGVIALLPEIDKIKAGELLC